MQTTKQIVCVVDDDPQVCESLSLMINSADMESRTYLSAETFLDDCHRLPNAPKCLVLDARMPGMDGLELQKTLAAKGIDMPVIMISGCADIPMAVEAMSAGALDFFEKPFSRQAMLSRIRAALDLDARRQCQSARRAEVLQRIARLSDRQHEVLELLVAGKRSKQIAAELGIGEKTVAKHRAGVLEKMGVESVVELVRLMDSAEADVQRPRAMV
jgi:FixJ family two-component response regulator